MLFSLLTNHTLQHLELKVILVTHLLVVYLRLLVLLEQTQQTLNQFWMLKT